AELVRQGAALFCACLPALDAQISGGLAVQAEAPGEGGYDLGERPVEFGNFQQTPTLILIAGLFRAPFEISNGGGKAWSSEGIHWHLWKGGSKSLNGRLVDWFRYKSEARDIC